MTTQEQMNAEWLAAKLGVERQVASGEISLEINKIVLAYIKAKTDIIEATMLGKEADKTSFEHKKAKK